MDDYRTADEMRHEIARIRLERRRAEARHEVDMEDQRRRLWVLDQKVSKLRSRFGLHVYVEAMKEVNGDDNNEMPIYAIKQQSALCNTLHRIEVYTKQLQLSKTHYEQQTRYMYGVASSIDLEKLNLEKNLINRMAVLGMEATSMKEHNDLILQRQRAELLKLGAVVDTKEWDFVDEFGSSSRQTKIPQHPASTPLPSLPLDLTAFFQQFEHMAQTMSTKKDHKNPTPINSANVIAALHRHMHPSKAAKKTMERSSFVANVA
eukprot:CAMPEP_0116579158 /NCGR_PEP_ID=MMETSP0397-20121206/22103_1 /TAXON_ID=216820 /ORGANISM="Cyclophora tenuis, Strain ECT3854" /LENGTH=261 /DNA_ID=CAMNT_0004108621 /DNA_START=182 /DNA_END=967 /DNA_ORIENTATION=+